MKKETVRTEEELEKAIKKSKELMESGKIDKRTFLEQQIVFMDEALKLPISPTKKLYIKQSLNLVKRTLNMYGMVKKMNKSLENGK